LKKIDKRNQPDFTNTYTIYIVKRNRYIQLTELNLLYYCVL